MGFGDWIKGLFGKKDTSESNGPTSDTAGSAADTGATGDTPADAEQPSAPDAP